jgi:epoxyqueuosine reductase
MLPSGYVDTLRSVGTAAGLARIGVASAAPFTETRVVLEDRKRAGLHGGMQFTYRNPARSTEPERAMAGVQTLVVGARSYPADQSDPPSTRPGERRAPLARVARYASADHYGALRRGLDAIADRLRADGWSARVLLDDNALVDRAAAHRAGLGWFGKNANLLVDGAGSYFVLGSVLTDAPLPVHGEPVPDGCGSCTRCLDRCPTGALIAPGVLDARRCLAWLVQQHGVFPIEYRVALGDRLYGCDDCQEACPPTVRHGRRLGLDETPADATFIGVLELLAATDDELLHRFGRWYIPRREARYLRRNALIVLGNVAAVPIDRAVRSALQRALVDPDPIVRGHAVWAARRLDGPGLIDGMVDDPDPIVRSELAATVPLRSGSMAIATTVPTFAPAHPSHPGAF